MVRLLIIDVYEWCLLGCMYAVAFVWQPGVAKEDLREVPHKGVCCFAWGQSRQTLALGTVKGGVVLHDVAACNTRKEKVLHVHNKPIRRIAWVDETRLATACDDRTVAILDSKGNCSRTL